ncbi:MAG TPA: preprotein translocase subunit SecA, partial [Clostridiales bacterium]|nr:preprotein translocase subunit SecA [Clostridiales bacterium]
VGTVSIDKSEILSALLSKRGIPHNVLNAKLHAKEAEIVAQAGKFGAVTISTNMAGRGTDIMLGGNPVYMAKAQLAREGYDEELIRLCDSFFDTEDEAILDIREKFAQLNARYKDAISKEVQKVKDAGGLYIIGSERHESRRVDNQLRGRSGRQGDPGASMFFLSFEDDLLRLFGGERLLRIANSMPQSDEIVINMRIMSNSIENAQKGIESRNFSRRKNVLMYDDVMNQQRSIIYKQRREVLDGADVQDTIKNMMDSWITSSVEQACSADSPEDWNFDLIREQFQGMFTTDRDFRYTPAQLDELTAEFITDLIRDRALQRYASQEALFGSDMFREVE